MPLEPFIDQSTGNEFDAYLAEVRSLGGLSGSPVLVALNPYTRLNIFGKDKMAQPIDGLYFYLLGLVRGHWEQRFEGAFEGSAIENLNTGIAMVTPIAEVLPLLEREEFVHQRKEIDKTLARERDKPVKDIAPAEREDDCS